MTRPLIALAMSPAKPLRAVYDEVLGDVADLAYLPDLDEAAQLAALDRATALIGASLTRDMPPAALDHLSGLKFIQALTAGVDHLPFSQFPAGVPVACNAGAYAEAMAEHVVALSLCGAKRLQIEHAALAHGEFHQHEPMNRGLAGGTCGLLGFGGMGREVARRMHALGMKVHAINRSGKTDQDIEFIGTMDDLDTVLAAADVLVIALSLTRQTEGLIGAAKLALMKKDAILVNVARGEILDEDALYAHLVANPDFFAGIESWWVEPVRHGEFRMKHPFLDLPNVIGSPHNSPRVPSTAGRAARRAAQNVRRLLDGETPHHIVGPDEMLR